MVSLAKSENLNYALSMHLFLFSVSPTDLFLLVLSFGLGLLSVGFKANRGVGIAVQVAILLIKITKHFADTHPDGLHFHPTHKKQLDKLHYHAQQYNQGYKITSETGAKG